MEHRAEYLLPRSFYPEETVRKIASRDPAAALAAAPRGTFCFTIYDVETAPDLGPDFTVTPKAKNRTGRYYIGGTLHTVDEVEAAGHDILASNMRANKWPLVIHCPTGNWQPFEDTDTLLEPVRTG